MAAPRGTLLTIFAILFVLLGISNAMKPLEASEQQGFVLFGQRLSGTPNQIAGPLFALYLWGYALGIWRMRRWALPMGVAYAVYVVLNLALYTATSDEVPAWPFMLGYAVVAIGVSGGAAYLLWQRREELT
ncbi:MAG: hypothetical protein AB1689_23360 [Thermodesulfobacteriota bacterium]